MNRHHFLSYYCAFVVIVSLYYLYWYKQDGNEAVGVQRFKTAKGNVTIEELEENVFVPNGYLFVGYHQKMIPKLNYIHGAPTCNQVSSNGLNPSMNPQIMLRDNYTLQNYMTTSSCYFNETLNNSPAFLEQRAAKWGKEVMEAGVENVMAKNFPVMTYVDSDAVYYATKYHSIAGMWGAVIGSETPWVEIICLANGAKKIVTVDYQMQRIGHPDVVFLHAYDLVKAGELYYDAFDFVVSFSSIEHSGLGRYGDPFDPIGDIREIQKVHCILKPGGLFFLGIPVGQDDLGWNCHRTYGRLRLPFMFVGFELLNTFYRNEMPLDLKVDYFEDNHGGDPLKFLHFVYVLKKI